MDRWEDEAQENHAVVKYKDNQSFIIKISNHTTVSQVLSKACEKWKLPEERHILKYHSEELLESDRNIGTSLPPNSTLHVEELEPDRDLAQEDESVYVSLQLEGTIFRKPFQKTDTLTQVLNELYDACNDTFSNKDGSKHKICKSSSGKRINSKCKIVLAKNEKLLILLPGGTITLDQGDFDTTTLDDFKHDGHIFLSFLIEDLEDVPLLDDDQDEVLQSSHNSLIIDNSGRKPSKVEESVFSVAKVKQMLEKGPKKDLKEDHSNLTMSVKPLQETELFERHGLVYKLSSDDSSSPDLLHMKNQDDSSFIYTQSWITVCFQDNIAIQASFAPFEYVQDIKTYLRKFLVKPNGDFHLSLASGGTPLDDNESIFTSGLVPYAKLYFVQVYPEQADGTEAESQVNQTSESQVNQTAELQINSINTKYLKKVVTESVAAATAIHFSQTLPEITIESEVFKPKSEETPWEKLKVVNNNKQDNK